MLLLAVPGSGKTTVLVSRVANMIMCNGTEPSAMLNVTFSRDAARDLARRYDFLFGGMTTRQPRFSTIHSFCFGLLSESYKDKGVRLPVIIGSKGCDDQNILLGRIYHKLSGNKAVMGEIRSMAAYMSRTRNSVSDPEQYPAFYSEIFEEYQRYKAEKGLIDFDDMLQSVLTMLEMDTDLLDRQRKRYKYISVDESQDTSLLQHRIIRLLAEKSKNIFMVGDEDQSIYGFRGAYPGEMLDFARTYPDSEIIFMDKNHRSAKTIVSAAARFISSNKDRYQKKMNASRRDEGEISAVCLDDHSMQAEYVISRLRALSGTGSTAVLFRNNISALPVAALLSRQALPFKALDSGEECFTDPAYTEMMKRICLHEFNNIKPAEAVLQAYDRMQSEGVIKTVNATIWDLLSKEAALEQTIKGFISRMDKLRKDMKNGLDADNPDAVLLCTAHSSKGLEFDNVIVIDLVDNIFPSAAASEAYEKGDERLIEEEARLFYVCITRARNRLELVTYLVQESKRVRPSDFIERLTGRQAEILSGKSSDSQYRPGMMISHNSFGKGDILGFDPKKGLLTVLFKKHGIQRISVFELKDNVSIYEASVL